MEFQLRVALQVNGKLGLPACCLWLSLHSHKNFDLIFEDLLQPLCLCEGRTPKPRAAEGRQPSLHPCSALAALQSTSEPGEQGQGRGGDEERASPQHLTQPPPQSGHQLPLTTDASADSHPAQVALF